MRYSTALFAVVAGSFVILAEIPAQQLHAQQHQISLASKGEAVPGIKPAKVHIPPAEAAAANDRGEQLRKKKDYDGAIKEFTEAIRIDPGFSWPYNNRGLAYAANGNFDDALKDYAEALRLDPNYTYPYNNRALVWAAKGEFDNAVKDYSEAIRLNPKYTFPYFNRGIIRERKGEYQQAIEDYAEAIQLDSKFAPALNSLAWLRATCPDDRFRAGREAIQFATTACEVTGWKSFAELDTLAAAYAEAGDFTMAVIWQLTAVEHAAESEKQKANERLDLYRANKPYRHPPK
jgi:tetratricopeptide (TPR) repeat protein